MDVKVEQNLINYKLDSKTRTALIGMIIVGLVSLAIAAFGFGHENTTS